MTPVATENNPDLQIEHALEPPTGEEFGDKEMITFQIFSSADITPSQTLAKEVSFSVHHALDTSKCRQ